MKANANIQLTQYSNYNYHIPASTNRITDERIILSFSQSGSSRASSDVSIRNADGGFPFSGNQASSKSLNLLGSVQVMYTQDITIIINNNMYEYLVFHLSSSPICNKIK